LSSPFTLNLEPSLLRLLPSSSSFFFSTSFLLTAIITHSISLLLHSAPKASTTHALLFHSNKDPTINVSDWFAEAAGPWIFRLDNCRELK